jgi:squalene-hopene/tetraprenyl-beta-curcumene cyclase
MIVTIASDQFEHLRGIPAMFRKKTVAMTLLCPWMFACSLAAGQEPGEGNGKKTLDAPSTNSPDEPMAQQFSARKAAEFLDQVSLNWTQERKCGTCHTNYAYMLARPVFGERSNPAAHEIRRFFEHRAANWDTAKPRWDTEVVATAVTLAINDAETTGKLHPITRSALDRMWTLQQEDGAWDWLKCDWPPLESDDYYGAVFVALGVGLAPDGYSETPAARSGMEKVRKYLAQNPAPYLHHKAVLLWAAVKMPDLMSQDQRAATVRELLGRQRPDGGWSLPSLGDWTRHDGSDNDPVSAPSDAYATGLVIYVLRQTGVAAEHDAVRRGIAWLRGSQRESGRWFTRSVSNDKYHFISNAGTAYAVMALASCDALKPE